MQRKQKPPFSNGTSRASTLKLDCDSGPPAKKRKLKPLSAISRPAAFEPGSSQSTSLSQPGPLIKEDSLEEIVTSDPPHTVAHRPELDALDDMLWVDKYEPQTEAQLAVHPRKVRDVRQWLIDALGDGTSSKLRQYRRILVLTGPAGTGKTATMRVLSKELGFGILEWGNGADERFDNRLIDVDNHAEYEGPIDKFRKFFTRATSCASLSFSPATSVHNSLPSSQAPLSQRIRLPLKSDMQRQIILLEDLPNVLHSGTQEVFHAALRRLVESSTPPASPVVIIVSDAGARGEDAEDVIGGISASWKGKGRDILDVRTILPSYVMFSPYVTQISFNPIAPTLIKKALLSLLNKRISARSQTPSSSDILDLVVESSNGDIRSALMALQFASTPVLTLRATNTKGKNRKKSQDSRALLEAVTRREQALALFHLVGKVLYNKRKGDPPGTSASAKDKQRDKDIDSRLADSPCLPSHLKHHERKPSRVDIEALYADSPIDASLLSLYIHQNYTQYCDHVEECAGVMDRLSWADANGGGSWLQTNPHRFHLVTLGTMHSLPTPVTRRGQKAYKPEFFEALKQERESESAVRDVHDWLQNNGSLGSGWTRQDICTDLGAVLTALNSIDIFNLRPPVTHTRFSKLEFVRNSETAAELTDENDPLPDVQLLEEDVVISSSQREVDSRGWLEDDDIEEFGP